MPIQGTMLICCFIISSLHFTSFHLFLSVLYQGSIQTRPFVCAFPYVSFSHFPPVQFAFLRIFNVARTSLVVCKCLICIPTLTGPRRGGVEWPPRSAAGSWRRAARPIPRAGHDTARATALSAKGGLSGKGLWRRREEGRAADSDRDEGLGQGGEGGLVGPKNSEATKQAARANQPLCNNPSGGRHCRRKKIVLRSGRDKQQATHKIRSSQETRCDFYWAGPK